LTLTEYMSPERFPLTTRTGLTPRLQFVTDAAELERLRAVLATGVTPTEEQWIRLGELEEKEQARPTLLAMLWPSQPTG